jgi:hypothetical protein
MGMSKKQPIIIFSFLTITMVGFQNCAKVGVADLAASSNQKIAGDLVNEDPIVETQDPGDGGPIVDEPGSPNMPPSNPPIVTAPPDVTNPPSDQPPTLPPVVSVPPKQNPPKDGGGCDGHDGDKKPPIVKNPMPAPIDPISDDKSCRPLNQIGLALSSKEMQSVKCLRNPNENCLIICHRPPGNPSNARNKIVGSEQAVKAHLAHGDTLGVCSPDENPNDVQVCEDDEERHYDNHEDRKHGRNDRDQEHDHDT